MSVALTYLRDLSESDLYFIVTTIVDKRRDYEHICNLLKDKPDLIEIMLKDNKLFQNVQDDEDILLKISPFLLFSILLLQARKEMERRTYTMEIISQKERVPIFDARDATKLLDNKDVRAYLAHMLASFTRVNSTTVVYKSRGMTYQRHFSELNFDDVLELSELVEPPYRYDFYKRLADISLFITGIYPESLRSGPDPTCEQVPARYIGHDKRSLHDYEEEGKRYYDLASSYDEAREQGLDHVLSLLSEKYTLARKPLNYLSQNYLYKYRNKWFA